MTPPHQDDVQSHYATLSPSYTQRSNKACNAAYIALIRKYLGNCNRVLEVGAGSALLIQSLDCPVRVAVDYTVPMLQEALAPPWIPKIGADGAQLPFRDDSFDGIFTINVLEHVPDPEAFMEDTARTLAPGGTLVAITPNGNVAWLLDLLEKLHLKLPEGPHTFLTTADLKDLVPDGCTRIAHECFLALPAGPLPLVIFIDAFAAGRGLFQFLILRKDPI